MTIWSPPDINAPHITTCRGKFVINTGAGWDGVGDHMWHYDTFEKAHANFWLAANVNNSDFSHPSSW